MIPFSRPCLFVAVAVMAVLSGFTAPQPLSFGTIPAAWADDDDDGGDDDGDSGGGSGSGDRSSGRSAGSRSGEDVLRFLRRFDLRRERAPVRARPTAAPRPLPTHAPELVVDGLAAGDLAMLLSEGFALLETVPLADRASTLTRLSAPPGLSLEQARNRVRLMPSGANTDLNHFYRTGEAATSVGAVPPTPGCGHENCAAHQLIAWPAASVRARACPASRQPIGVIDTGVNAGHALLQGAKVELVEIGSRGEDPSAQVHGTAVVSVLAGTAGGRVEGLLRETPLIVADVFSRKGKDERADVVALLRGLDEMDRRNVRLVNLSLTGPANTVLEATVKRLVDERRMVLVAAAGNGGPGAGTAYRGSDRRDGRRRTWTDLPLRAARPASGHGRAGRGPDARHLGQRRAAENRHLLRNAVRHLGRRPDPFKEAGPVAGGGRRPPCRGRARSWRARP